MEHLRARFAVQPATTTPVVFEGYASVFGTLIDTYVPTIIEPGAFTRTIKENFSRIKILWQHDDREPIGKPLALKEDQRGLYLKAELSATQRALDAAQLLKDGVLTEMSIGFDPVNAYFKQVNNEQVRHIIEVKLWEVSLVTFAANKDATIAAVHRRSPTIDERMAEVDGLYAAHRANERATTFEATMTELRMTELDLMASRLRAK